jgi:hypothetical protein
MTISALRGGLKKFRKKIRARLPHLDYSEAERKCPQGLPIAKLMLEAKKKLDT